MDTLLGCFFYLKAAQAHKQKAPACNLALEETGTSQTCFGQNISLRLEGICLWWLVLGQSPGFLLQEVLPQRKPVVKKNVTDFCRTRHRHQKKCDTKSGVYPVYSNSRVEFPQFSRDGSLPGLSWDQNTQRKAWRRKTIETRFMQRKACENDAIRVKLRVGSNNMVIQRHRCCFISVGKPSNVIYISLYYLYLFVKTPQDSEELSSKNLHSFVAFDWYSYWGYCCVPTTLSIETLHA